MAMNFFGFGPGAARCNALAPPPKKQFRLSIAPEILEARRRKLGIAHGVLDVLVSKVSLKGTGIVALVGQGEAAGMAQHVRVRLEAELGGLAGTLDHAREPGRAEGRAALGCEHEGRLGLLLALELAQGAQLVA